MSRFGQLVLATAFSATFVGMSTGQTTWSGLGDGSSWSDPANWDPAGVPGAADSVIVSVSATIVVDVPAAVKSVTLMGFNSMLDLANSLTVNGTLQQASTSSVITGAGDLTISGLYDWQAGTLSGPGDVGVDGEVRLSTGGAKVLDRRRFRKIPGRLKYVQSGWNFSGGNGAVIEIGDGDELLINTTSASNAFAVFDGSTSPPIIDNSGVLQKVGGAGGTVAIEWDVDNKGTVQVDQAGQLRLDGALLNSAGAYRALSTDAVLDFGGAGQAYTFDASAVLEGAGTISFSSGTTTLAGTLNAGTTEITDRLNNGSSVTIASTAQLPADFDVLNVATRGDLTVELTAPISAGSLSLDFGSRLAVASPMTISGAAQLLDRTAVFSSSEDLTVEGLLTWHGGTQAGSGRTIANGGLLLPGGAGSASFDKFLDGRTLIIPSGQSAVVTGNSGVRLGNGAVLEIAAGATMDVQTQADFRRLVGSTTEPVIRNAGIFKRSAGGFDTWVEIAVENSGVIEVSDGELRLSGDLTDAGGTYRALTENVTLNFASVDNEITFGPASRLEGEGTIQFSGQGKSVSIEGTLDAAHFDVSGGNTIATVTVASTADIVRIGSETLKVALRGYLVTLFSDPIVTKDLELGALSEMTLNSTLTVTDSWFQHSNPNTLRTEFPVEVNGSATWQGGELEGGGSIRFNAGLQIPGDASSFNNQKTLDGFRLIVPGGQSAVVTGNANTLLGNGAVLELESGATMDVQTEADFRLLSGSNTEPVIQNSGLFKKSGGGFQTWVEVDVENGGTIEVSDGELRLSADLRDTGGTYRALTEGATLNFASIDNEVVFGPSSRLEGEGTIQFIGQGKSVSIEGTIDAANFAVSGGNTLATVTVASTAEVLRIGSESLNVTVRGNLVTLFADPILTRSFELASLSELTLNSRLTVTDSWLQGFAPNTLRSAFPVRVDGAATWQGGSFEGGGSIRFNDGLDVTGDAGSASFSKRLDGFTLVIPSGATANYTGTRNLEGGNGAVMEIEPGATFDIQQWGNVAEFSGSTQAPRLENAGTILKSGGDFASRIEWEVINTGLISITNSELVCCTGQHLTNEAGGVISGTAVLDIQQATFTNNGTIAPGGDTPGTLVIRGDYVNAPGTLSILMDGADASRLDVEGTARLGGGLEMVNPAAPLPDGSRYQILTASAVVDTFETAEGPILFSSEADVAYAPTEVVVDIVPVANRAPETWPDVAYTLRDSSVTIDVLWNDVDLDRDSLQLVSATDGSSGTTAVVAGRVVYSPNGGAVGVDAFTYVAQDPDGEQTSDSVVVEVVDPAISLFSFAGPETPGGDPGVIRHRPVAVDFGLLADLVSGVGDRIALPLFDGGLTLVSRGWTENWPDGHVSWIGTDRSGDYVILEIDLASETLYARGCAGTQAVKINRLPDGSHRLSQMDPAAFPENVNDTGTGDLSRFEGEEIPILEVTEQMFNPDDSTAGKRATSVVDILVLYTAVARAAAGSDSAMISQIRSVVNLTNLTFDAGLLDVRLRLAAVAEVQFGETRDAERDLDRLVAIGRRSSSALFGLRARYGADIVGLIVSQLSGSAGRAGAVVDPDPDEAFFVAEDGAAFGANFTFTHELGHLFGAEHDEEVEGLSPNSDAGWVNPPKFWTSTGDVMTSNGSTVPSGPNQWRTIMAYNEHCDEQNGLFSDDDVPWCVRVPRWSDPNDKWSNAAGGPFRPLGEPPRLGADNNDRIRRFAPTVAGWMSPAAVITGVVLDAQTGLPLDSVVIQQSAEFGVDDTTDTNGFYEIVAPRSGGATLTPVLADYIFSPASASFASTTTFNFTGYRLYDVTGMVTESSTGLEGVDVRAAPQTGLTPAEIAISAEGTTDSSGDYSFEIPYGWSGRLTPFLRSHDISPARLDVALIESDTTFNFTASIKKYTVSLSLRDVTTNSPISGARVYRWLPDTTNAAGFFSREVEHDANFEFLPQRLGYNFEPFVVDTSVAEDFHFDFNGFPGGTARSDWPKESRDPANRGALGAPSADGRAKWWRPLKANPVAPVIGPEDRIWVGSYEGGLTNGWIQRFHQTGDTIGGDWDVSPFPTIDAIAGPVLGTAGYLFVAWSNLSGNFTGLRAFEYLRIGDDVDTPVLADCCVESVAIGPDASVYVLTGGVLYKTVPSVNEIGEIDSLSALAPFFAATASLTGTPAIDAIGNLYIGDVAGSLNAIDSAGNLLWSVPTGGPVRSSPALGADGSVYVGSEGGQLVAVSSTGNQQWTFQTGSGIVVQPVIGSDGTVYVGNSAGRVVAVAPESGQLRWSLTLPAAVSAAPAISNIRVRRLATTADEEILYMPVADTVLFAVNAVGSSRGTVRWTLETMAETITSPALSQHGLYFGEQYPDGTGRLVRIAPLSRALTQYTVIRQDGFLFPDEIAVILWAEQSGGPLAFVDGFPDDPCEGGPLYIPDCPTLTEFDKTTPLLTIGAERNLVLGLAERTSAIDAIARGETSDGLLLTTPFRLSQDEVRAVVVGGLTDPEAFAPNPDGESTELGVFLSEDLQDVVTNDEMVFVLTGNLVTDAPAATFSLIGQETTTFDALSFGELSSVLAVPPGAFQLALDFGARPGKTLGEQQLFQLDLSEQAGNLVTLLSAGFVDPAANQNGPGVSVVGASSSGPVVVSNEAADRLELPTKFAVHGVFPNPFATQATLRYSVPHTDHVRIDVYDLIGRRVVTLADEQESPGVKEILFRPRGLASGLYFVRFEAGGTVVTRKVVVAR